MSDSSVFFTSMSSVMNQWSDFRIGRNLYRSYFEQQNELAKTQYDSFVNDSLFSNSDESIVSDQLKSLTESTVESADKLTEIVSADDFDIEKAYSAVSSFADDYNKLISETSDSNNDTIKTKTDYMKNMSVIYSDRLSQVGISVKEDGTLSVDKEKFLKADTTVLKNTFGSNNSLSKYVSSQAGLLSKYSESDAYINNKSYYTTSGKISNTLNKNASLLNGYTLNDLI